MAAGNEEAPRLTRAHRILVRVVVTGAVLIAGIGFAGSYAAVRELALKKGFGAFSYVFPIGIDAGICVLLALDLLLTWIRIPFPLLRQTAWLLTAATIAFNGAAAWPDPLGVGMHAVIPVLFVVAVEAARHAIGRIADITAAKHMEGVRLTRWALSPLPTFLLWRRMKLWELRSYEQVIKLEQERLVYQAHLRSRFGRGWRRKAPVESLIPLRLARYGIPLSETAPAGRAAAGIDETPIQFAGVRAPLPPQRRSPGPTAAGEPELEPAQAGSPEPQSTKPGPCAQTDHQDGPVLQTARDGQRLAVAYQAWIDAFGSEPTSAQFGRWLQDRYGIATAADEPLSNEHLASLLQFIRQRHSLGVDAGTQGEPESADDGWGNYFYNAWLSYAEQQGDYPDAGALATYVYERDQITSTGGQPITGGDLEASVRSFQQREFDQVEPPAGSSAVQAAQQPVPQALPIESGDEAQAVVAAAQASMDTRRPGVNANVDAQQDEGPLSVDTTALTTVDRYYLAWTDFQTKYGDEPKAEQLSAYLATKDMKGRGGKPVSPSTLRRYLLPFRVYALWAVQRVYTANPPLDVIAQECASRGITAQHNRPLTSDYIGVQVDDFERRWHALTRHHAETQH